jgi:hypothetical protein
MLNLLSEGLLFKTIRQLPDSKPSTKKKQINIFLTNYQSELIFVSYNQNKLTLSEGSPLPFDEMSRSPVIPHYWAFIFNSGTKETFYG